MNKVQSAAEQRKIDLLCIGHCCHDMTEEGPMLGGTSSYASIAAQQLGFRSAVLTSVGPDFLFIDAFESRGILLQLIAATATTVFENVYQGDQRTQYLRSRAATITARDLSEFQDSTIVLLGGIADEIDFSITAQFPKSLVCATIQGSIRQWDDAGLVSPKAMDWADLAGVDVVILSRDDLRGLADPLPEINRFVPHVVVTDGAGDVLIYKDDQQYTYPVYPVVEIEATGAGDVFATAYIMQYQQTGDVTEACIYAHCASSFIIEGIGLSSLPTPEKISDRAARYRAMFLS